MSELSNPHDKFFKETFSRPEVIRSFLEEYLPGEVSAVLDLDSLELQKDSFITADLEEYFSDLLYRCLLREDPIQAEGDGIFVYLLLEHKSSPERLTPLQLLEYMVRIWVQQTKRGVKTLPVIIPMVVYHGRTRWQVARDFAELFSGPDVLRGYRPSFGYELLDLGTYNDEEIQGLATLQIGLLLLKYIYEPLLPEMLPGIFSLAKDLADVKTAVQYLYVALRYLSVAADQVTREELTAAYHEVLSDQGDNIMPTLAEQWIEEGKQEGLQQGLREGKKQGILNSIVDLLRLRFDVAPPVLTERLATIEEPETLSLILRQAATADSLSDFERFLDTL
jgi:predicted transposase/invertase (TIGR01784 family)